MVNRQFSLSKTMCMARIYLIKGLLISDQKNIEWMSTFQKLLVWQTNRFISEDLISADMDYNLSVCL